MTSTRRRLVGDAALLRTGFAAVRDELGVVEGFPPAVLAEARTAAAADPTKDRTDLTDLPFVTIDPPGSQDLDQAMHLSRTAAGYRVRYAIADVAAFVTPGGALDEAARRRGSTIYCPDRRVPLHPPSLSEDAASLLPGRDRPAVVWDLSLDREGRTTDVVVHRALVRSRAQLDYPTEQRRLDAGVADDDVIALLAEIGTARAALERARGGVSLGRPEQEVVADDGGWGLRFRAPLPVEEHNAQISLLTGIAAAELMLAGGVGVLRTMPAADGRDLRRLRRQALALGVPWPEDAAYGDVLATVDHGQPATAAFLTQAITLFRGAAWQGFVGEPPTDHVHGAIAAPYAHVTAPLRRLVDRWGTEICLAVCAGAPVPDWVLASLDEVPTEMAEAARRAAAVDRACTDLVESVVLARVVGQELDGVALDDRTVQLTEPAVVARAVDDDLPAGGHVRVRVVAADPTTRTVRLARVG